MTTVSRLGGNKEKQVQVLSPAHMKQKDALSTLSALIDPGKTGHRGDEYQCSLEIAL